MCDTLDIDPAQIADPVLRALVQRLLNLVEDQLAEIADLRAEVQRLRDEVARLKGGSGRPQIKPGVPRAVATDDSSERERHVSRPHHKTSKVAALTIDRVVDLAVPPAQRPADAVFKGYQEVVVQDVRVQVETICYRKAKWDLPDDASDLSGIVAARVSRSVRAGRADAGGRLASRRADERGQHPDVAA